MKTITMSYISKNLRLFDKSGHPVGIGAIRLAMESIHMYSLGYVKGKRYMKYPKCFFSLLKGHLKKHGYAEK